MTLEETIRAYAKKGELVHLSLAATIGGEFKVIFAAASPAGGYATAVDKDPVAAILAAFKAAPVKPARITKPKEITDTVTTADAVVTEDAPTLSDWTTP